eukprot:1856453-Rhodomonas_salina.1
MYAIEAKLEALCEKLIQEGAKAVRTTPSVVAKRQEKEEEKRMEVTSQGGTRAPEVLYGMGKKYR